MEDRHPRLARCGVPQLHADTERAFPGRAGGDRRGVPPGRRAMGLRGRGLLDLCRPHVGRGDADFRLHAFTHPSILVDHFFSHRYDYRREWMRCIDILTAPEAHVGLHKRAIRAAAEVVDSPAGVLFVRAPEDVAFQWAGSWNMPAVTMPIPPGHPLVPAFRDGDWVVVLDEMTEARDWFEELPRAWLAVP